MSDRGVPHAVPDHSRSRDATAPPPDDRSAFPLIRPGTPVMVRPGNRVHVGSDPRRSLVVDLMSPLRADDVAALLRGLTRPRSGADIIRRAELIGLAAADLGAILAQLTDAGLAVAAPSPVTPLRIRLHGRGPITDLLSISLTDAGMAPRRSTRRLSLAASTDGWTSNLVVLTDYLVHDPSNIKALNAARVPHLQVRVRDGVGVVGPLVLPGLSSCLRCADHHRATMEPDWPMLAAQMVEQRGHAAAGTVRGTAAIAQVQIEDLAAALGSGTTRPPPQLLNRALEFRPGPAELVATEWPPHPLCDCRPAIARAG
ncbi:hypothetical protein V1Y59_01755 [Gordonia sp. PKS22-38]|uniref:Bacteriocin biosynthesis cyclodehydratase domain-containing protein n=1 Tax=Gordonia prachuapensis TaxID=3115651 RepID=A0ABU7MPW4_9ACTN|nr:hypothetical protein [Gordonia sp. PKS22-38]